MSVSLLAKVDDDELDDCPLTPVFRIVIWATYSGLCLQIVV